MFNQAYGAGYRAGIISDTAVCPYPRERFLSCFAWRNGLNDGVLKRLFNSEPFFKCQMAFEAFFIAFCFTTIVVLSIL